MRTSRDDNMCVNRRTEELFKCIQKFQLQVEINQIRNYLENIIGYTYIRPLCSPINVFNDESNLLV